MACSPGGRPSKACYETTIAVINKASAWLAAHAQGTAFGGEAVKALPPERRREVAAKLMPAIRGRISASERKIGHFTDAPEVLEFVDSRDLEAARGARHVLPRPLPAHQNPAAGPAVRSGGDEPRRGRGVARRQPRGLSRRLRRLLRALQAAELAGDARSERRHLSRSRASACSPSPRTRRRRGSRPSSTSTRSTSCAAPRASAAMSGSPSRRRSTSNTGSSRKPSCSACRSRSRSPDASRSSPAAPAASGGRSPGGSWAKAPAWCSPTSTRRALKRRSPNSARRSARTRSPARSPT